MPKVKLTLKFAASVLPTDSDTKYMDTETAGFGFRVQPSGTKSWIIRYRFKGTGKSHLVGKYGELTLKQARKIAQDRLELVRQGIDPNEQRRAGREAYTVAQFADEYFKDYAALQKRESTVKNQHNQLKRDILPKLGRKKLEAVTTKELASLHRSMSDTPYQANRVLALIHHMFTIAIKWKIVKENPADAVDKYPEQARERYLNTEEIGRLTTALENHHNKHAANATRLLTFTGARKSEVLKMTWDQIDWEHHTWTKKAAFTKQNKLHHVGFALAAMQVLASIKEEQEREGVTTPYVFPSRNQKGEEAPLADIKRFWKGIREQTDLEGVRIHDLRHTVGSQLAMKGLSAPIIAALLGHTQMQTTMKYMHLAVDPVKQASNIMADIVTAGTEKPSAEVIPLQLQK